MLFQEKPYCVLFSERVLELVWQYVLKCIAGRNLNKTKINIIIIKKKNQKNQKGFWLLKFLWYPNWNTFKEASSFILPKNTAKLVCSRVSEYHFWRYREFSFTYFFLLGKFQDIKGLQHRKLIRTAFSISFFFYTRGFHV